MLPQNQKAQGLMFIVENVLTKYKLLTLETPFAKVE